MATAEVENLEDKLAYLSEQREIQDEREFPFRLLRHYASSVQHRKYHNIDIITVVGRRLPLGVNPVTQGLGRHGVSWAESGGG